MPFKVKKQCATCVLIHAGDQKLFDRINQSREFVPGGESLLGLQRNYPQLSYKSIYNHAKKHQAPSQAKLAKQRHQFETKQSLREVEQIAGDGAVTVAKVARHYTEDIAELKVIAMEGIRNGDTKVSAAVLAKLIDIEAKIEEKAKDRNLVVMKMVHHFNAQKGDPQSYMKYTVDDYDDTAGNGEHYEEGEVLSEAQDAS